MDTKKKKKKKVAHPDNGMLVLKRNEGFPGGTVVKDLPVNAGNTGSSPGAGRSHMLWSN